MDRMVNNIRLVWKLACMFRTCNPIVKFSKYKFLNKLLNGVTLLKITQTVTWIQPYICVCVWERERERERDLNLNSPLWKNWVILVTHKALEDLT